MPNETPDAAEDFDFNPVAAAWELREPAPARSEVDKVQVGFAHAAWRIDQGISMPV